MSSFTEAQRVEMMAIVRESVVAGVVGMFASGSMANLGGDSGRAVAVPEASEMQSRGVQGASPVAVVSQGMERLVVDGPEQVGSEGSAAEGSVDLSSAASSWADRVSVDATGPTGGGAGVGISFTVPDESVSVEGAPVVVSASQPGKASTKFFKEFVRVPRVKAYARFVQSKFGIKIPSGAYTDLALVSYTAGTVPDAFVEGRKRLKQWEAIGDAAFALAMVLEQVGRDQAVASVQQLKASRLSNAHFSSLVVRCGMSAHVAYAPGVDPKTSVASADALECLAGVIYSHLGIGAVAVMMQHLGLTGSQG